MGKPFEQKGKRRLSEGEEAINNASIGESYTVIKTKSFDKKMSILGLISPALYIGAIAVGLLYVLKVFDIAVTITVLIIIAALLFVRSYIERRFAVIRFSEADFVYQTLDEIKIYRYEKIKKIVKIGENGAKVCFNDGFVLTLNHINGISDFIKMVEEYISKEENENV